MAPLGFDLSPKQWVEVNCQSLVGMEKEMNPKFQSTCSQLFYVLVFRGVYSKKYGL